MQCSEDVLLDAVRSGAALAGVASPTLYAWRFDAVQQCPPAVSGWGGAGHGKLSGACFHTMDLSWMFGTVSGFWPWIRPPNGASDWAATCEWNETARGERTFSDAVIRLWVQQASVGNRTLAPGAGWPAQQDAADVPAGRARLNLRLGNLTVLKGFRAAQCGWGKMAWS